MSGDTGRNFVRPDEDSVTSGKGCTFPGGAHEYQCGGTGVATVFGIHISTSHLSPLLT
jgi:hypothetical protein